MRVICVDDEQPALDNFKMKSKKLSEIESLHLFSDAEVALEWAKKNPVDVAFLDIEMSGINGIELARYLKEIDCNIRVIFITAFEQYALDAFRVNAIGYMLKPYTSQEIREALERASLIRYRPKKRVVIQTIPDLVVTVDGERVIWRRPKAEELFAFFVDKGNSGVTAGEAISCLWPERLADESLHSLYRMTYKRMYDVLKEKGINNIIASEGNRKYLVIDQVDCDLHRILSGDKRAIESYSGEYLRRYSWTEPRNAQLYSLKTAWER
ncbi:MAG: response regulator [Lachnospiraceae bacterium]